MRFLIFSDIHGNVEALNAVLAFAKKKKIAHFVCLGDLVGYGASPNEVIQKVRQLKPLSMIRGNHDKAVGGQESIDSFNPIAASAIRWTRKSVSKSHGDFLRRLDKGPKTVAGRFSICHGSPFDEDYYIFGEYDADEAFGYLNPGLGFFGHTHFPFVYIKHGDKVQGIFVDCEDYEVRIEEGRSYLINPGSVGQPRDRDPRASFIVYDADHKLVRFYRLDYDIEAAQKKIRKADLPHALADRLAVGL